MAEEGDGEEKMIVVGAGDMEGKIVVGAGDMEDEEKDGGWGGGGGGDEEICRSVDQFFPPPGFRFRPSDDELVRYYLLPKLQGREYVPNKAIIVDNVYQCHPDQLIGKYRDLGEGKSWYFLSLRLRKYQNGGRPLRNTEDGRGRWKASTGKKEKGGDDDGKARSCPWEKKKVAGDGTTKYCESVLAYFEGPSRRRERKSKLGILHISRQSLQF